MTLNSFVAKSIAIILALSLFAPLIAFSQTEPEAHVPATVEETAPAHVPVVESVTEVTEPGDIAPESVQETAPENIGEETTPPADAPVPESVQETAPAQEAVSGDALEGTMDPQVATSTESELIPIVDATSTEPAVEEIPVIENDVPALLPDEIPVAAVNDLTIIDSSLVRSTETVSEEFVPLRDSNDTLDPEFVIALSGKVIPTKKEGIIGASDIMTPPATSIDPESGTITVSGTCASPYYVVLLFKNQTDYQLDPRSFIVNRAYPCENGSYSYSIDRLPPSLANGTYYLMVGEQGERGAWWPTTSLTEVSINRSN